MATPHGETVCIRIDYLNRQGEQHHTMIYSTEPLSAEGPGVRLEAFLEAFAKLGRQVLQVQKFETMESTLYGGASSNDASALHGGNVVRLAQFSKRGPRAA
jgi:hypothetical protein